MVAPPSAGIPVEERRWDAGSLFPSTPRCQPPSQPCLLFPGEEEGVNEKPKGRQVSREGEKQHLLGQPGEEGSGAERRAAPPHFGEHPCAPRHRRQSIPVSEPAKRSAAEGGLRT